MPHPLETGTIRILKPDGSTAGTGFLVSQRLAATCAHVVTAAKSKPGDIIKFKFHLGDLEAQEAKVLKNGWSLENDIAILELAEKLPKWIHPIIMQSSRAMEGRSFQGLGYPNDGPVQARWVQGNIGGLVRIDQYSNPLLQIQGEEIDMGLSGSAVVNHATRKVIGMLTAYHDVKRPTTAPQVRFAYAISIETIWEVYPEIKKELPIYQPRSQLVEGINFLPYDYASRIQNFLSEYLGNPKHPEPFGGRENVLKDLDNWLDSKTQRLILAAPAGRGKSALLVRWLDRLVAREDLALVFIPVSIRFRTNLASTFFASLAARLAYLHGEDVPISTETPIDVWRGLASTYLNKQLADGKKILVVLDGLDEAGDWEATADLIPAELPNNLQIVVSARYLAGDTDAKPWSSRLGWEHKGKALTLDLAPLDSSGVADVLRRMGFPLDGLSRRVDIVAELHRLSKGDPLLVNLYVEDLWSRGEQASRLQPENLRSIKPGYEGYFDRWWDDQKKLWGEEAPLREKNVRLVFNLLCGAIGGLTKNDLVSLDSESELNTYVIEDALDELKRFVIGVPDERKEGEVGYVLTHPKLRDYFWSRLVEKEQKRLENQFVGWGERTIQALIEQKLKPADTPLYVLQYYGAHLECAKATIEKFLPFVETPYWHQAWFAYEGSYGGYLQDVIRVWNYSRIINAQQAKQNGVVSWLHVEVRCALIKATMVNLASSYFPELLEQLVKTKIWTVQQAQAYIRQIPEYSQREKIDLEFGMIGVTGSKHKVISLNLLYNYRNDSVDTILTLAQHIQNKHLQAEFLSALLPTVTCDEQTLIVDEVLNILQEITNPSWIPAILISIADYSNAENCDKIFTLVQQIDPWSKALVMCSLAGKFPDSYLNEILGILTDKKAMGEWAVACAWLELLKRLPKKYRATLLPKAIKIVRNITDDTARVLSLLNLLPFFVNKQKRFRLIDEIQNDINRNKKQLTSYSTIALMTELLPHIPEDSKQNYLNKTLIKIDLLDSNWGDNHWEKVRFYRRLLPYLSKSYVHDHVIYNANKIKEDWKRAIALISLIDGIAAEEKDNMLANIIEIANAMNDERAKMGLLCILSPYLSNDQQHETLRRVMENSNFIGDWKSQFGHWISLLVFSTNLSSKNIQKNIQRNIFQEILDIIRNHEPERDSLLREAEGALKGFSEEIKKSIINPKQLPSNKRIAALLKRHVADRKRYKSIERQINGPFKGFLEYLAINASSHSKVQLLENVQHAVYEDSKLKYELVSRYLLNSSTQERGDLFFDLEVLYPLILTLEEKDVFLETYQSTCDITTWWP